MENNEDIGLGEPRTDKAVNTRTNPDVGPTSANGLPKTKRETERLFWRHVTIGNDNECWLWTANAGRNGYGKTMRNKKAWGAHRLAWWLANGQPAMDPATQIRHKCDVRLCCNPAHLEPGTANDNSNDAIERGRTNGGKPKGCSHRDLKPQIFDLADAGVSRRGIAERLGMSERNVYYHLNKRERLATTVSQEIE